MFLMQVLMKMRRMAIVHQLPLPKEELLGSPQMTVSPFRQCKWTQGLVVQGEAREPLQSLLTLVRMRMRMTVLLSRLPLPKEE